MIEDAIRTRLLAVAAVSALVGTRVYPVQLPQAPTFPALSYQHISDIRLGHFSGPTGTPGTLLQVDSWASTYAAAKGLANAVRQGLDGYQGTVSGVVIQAVILENEADLDADTDLDRLGLYRVSQDYRVWWNE